MRYERAGKGIHQWVDVEVQDGERFGLIEQTTDEAEFGFCATVGLCFLSCQKNRPCGYRRGEDAGTDLRFIERGLIDFIFKCFGHFGALQDIVLAEEEPVLECELGEREPNYEFLPWEERPVKPAGQTLQMLDQRN